MKSGTSISLKISTNLPNQNRRFKRLCEASSPDQQQLFAEAERNEQQPTCAIHKRKRNQRQHHETHPPQRQTNPAHKKREPNLRSPKPLPSRGMHLRRRHPHRLPDHVPVSRMEIRHTQRKIHRKRSHNPRDLPLHNPKRKSLRRNQKIRSAPHGIISQSSLCVASLLGNSVEWLQPI